MLEWLSKINLCLITFLVTVLVANPVWADDTEIFFGRGSNAQTQPNVLFVLDASKSMLKYDCSDGTKQSTICRDGSPSGSATRLARLKQSLTDVLKNTSNINVGLMRFSAHDGGGAVLYPIRPIDQQFCEGKPCGSDRVFTAKSRPVHSADDAAESIAGDISLDQTSISLLKNPGTDEENSLVGLRFPKLFIPQGATITDARLQFTAIEDENSKAELNISIQDSHNAAPYTESKNDISDRPSAADIVSWDKIPGWNAGDTYDSPNLSKLIQHAVKKSDWCGGNAVALTLSGKGKRLLAAVDGGSGESPLLKVSYKLNNIPPSGGCIVSSIVAQLSNTLDDGTEKTVASRHRYKVQTNKHSVTVASPFKKLRYGYDSAIRFRNINIPVGSQVTNATITMTTHSSNWYSSQPDITIHAVNNANPVELNNQSRNISNRTLTAGVHWTGITEHPESETTSPTITSLIQSLVNKPDWESGNSVMFVLKPSGNGGHEFYSFEKNPSKAPVLKIDFKTKVRTPEENVIGPVSGVRNEIISEMESIITTWGTPTVGALIEAHRYYTGGEVYYGKERDGNSYHRSVEPRYSRVSTPDSYTGGEVVRDSRCNENSLDGERCASEYITGNAKYISPHDHACQSNHIVLLTDGEPTRETSARNIVQTQLGTNCRSLAKDAGLCGEEIARYMATNDQFPSEGEQFITTHTIGFNFTTQWLKDVASAGGGGYYTADTANQLSTALENIISAVRDEGSTFVAPGAAIDTFSRVSHRSDIYLAMFQPMTSPGWSGNLKRYDFQGKPAMLRDRNDSPAIDPDTGLFLDSSQSFWSSLPDGKNIARGGAAGRLNVNDRKVYTYTGTKENLTDITNRFAVTNTAIKSIDLGLDINEKDTRDSIIKWAIGHDVKDDDGDSNKEEGRFHIADPLHSRPVIATYGGTSDKPESVIFFGTNDGFLHAISTETGDEIFSFIPEEFFPNLGIIYEGNLAHDKVYGLDGTISLWSEDTNSNGIIEEGADHVYLYTGSRRGGSSYYSLDVTNVNSPKFKWQISNDTSGFSELGQSWSQALITSINYLGKETKVLIFGGGYDVAQDNKITREEDGIGRAIYIVDANNGNLLWSGGPLGGSENKSFDDMTYSFPATPKAVDTDGNGTIEQIYVGDTGGRIWRFDVNEKAKDIDELIHGGIVADLGTDGVMSDARRFYHSPDISFSHRNGVKTTNIAVGSGYQAHPLDTTIEDRFYLIRYPYDPIIDEDGNYQYGIKSTTLSSTGSIESTDKYTPITEIDLFNATDNLLGEGSIKEKTKAEQELAASEGWYIEMERSGEKILGSSVTFDNKILFSSYVPGRAPGGCSPEIGSGIFWAVNLWDATPAADLAEGDIDDLTKSDRNKLIPGGGIPAPVQTLFIDSGNKNDAEESKELQILAISGANRLLELDSSGLITRVYWSEYPNF